MTMNRISLREPIIIAWISVASVTAQVSGNTPLRAEPPASITVYQPVTEQLSRGIAVVHFRTDNLRVRAVFGPDAVSITPRAGHLHVSVDDAPWVWAHTSGQPVTVAGLAPGPHKIRAQLMNPNHQGLDEGTVTFEVPLGKGTQSAVQANASGVPSDATQHLATITVDPPLPEPLSRGVIFVRYSSDTRTSVASAGTAQSEYIRVKVDDALFHWSDASGNPIIVQGLTPGPHSIRIELVNAHDQVTDRQTIAVTVPQPAARQQ